MSRSVASRDGCWNHRMERKMAQQSAALLWKTHDRSWRKTEKSAKNFHGSIWNQYIAGDPLTNSDMRNESAWNRRNGERHSFFIYKGAATWQLNIDKWLLRNNLGRSCLSDKKPWHPPGHRYSQFQTGAGAAVIYLDKDINLRDMRWKSREKRLSPAALSAAGYMEE